MTHSEENYLKIIYHLFQAQPKGVSTNAIAEMMDTKASSVTDMIKKLADKELVHYQRYQGVKITELGQREAKMIIRNHRLWEVFLVDTLKFSWDEVHEVAEELEHIKSEKLISRLDEFLGFPTHDPHGDPIPDRNGDIIKIEKFLLSDAPQHTKLICVGVKDTSSEFLQFLNKYNIALGSEITITHKEDFDQSLTIVLNNQELMLSNKIASNLYVK
jgi:DtxR family transcriptional regulator, Mn-dependent transcriptional regulator